MYLDINYLSKWLFNKEQWMNKWENGKNNILKKKGKAYYKEILKIYRIL